MIRVEEVLFFGIDERNSIQTQNYMLRQRRSLQSNFNKFPRADA